MIADAVTALFVPGDRPDRYAKAAAAGADVVIIDLEDAVAADRKDAARTATVGALRGGELAAMVRVNADGALRRADLEALAGLDGRGLLGVMVPKAADAASLAEAGQATGRPVVALVESAAGVAAAGELAAVRGVARLAFGALDFALDVGATVDAVTGQVARAQVVIASRAAGLPAPWESPATELRDLAAVETSSRAAAALGFGDRLCIHPAQLPAVRAGFAPTEAELAWAREVVGAGDGVERVGDQMVDRPVLERARLLLRRAGAA